MNEINALELLKECEISHLPGYYCIKDVNHEYITCCDKLPGLLGFKSKEDLLGKSDYDIQCPAANQANDYVNEDDVVLTTQEGLTKIDVIYYSDNQPRTILYHKWPIYDNDDLIGVGCYTIELSQNLMNQFQQQIESLKATERLRNASLKEIKSDISNPYSLSPKQIECLRHIVRGKTYRQTGIDMGISKRTVESYVEEIKKKMACKSKSKIINFAINSGYFELY